MCWSIKSCVTVRSELHLSAHFGRNSSFPVAAEHTSYVASKAPAGLSCVVCDHLLHSLAFFSLTWCPNK